MKRYIGTKVINAKLMSRQAYNDFRGWTLPDDENGSDEGYLVEYVDGGKANTEQYAGYVSWSPTDVFEKAYHEAENMTFGEALEALKAGESVARAGWNGKGLKLGLCVPAENSDMTLPYIFMAYPSTPASDTAPENHINASVPWLASQTDMLAIDWKIVN